PTTPLKIMSYAVRDLFGYSIPDYYIIVTFAKPERIRLINLALFHGAAIATMGALGLWWPMAIWYGCLPTSFMMFFRLRLWLEHQGTERTSRLHLNAWQGFLLSPHKGWYHWEHHNWAGVPYYNLHKLRALAGTKDVMTLGEFCRYIKTAPSTASGQLFAKEDDLLHNANYVDETLDVERRAA
ncbi:MAG: fatty acid desaturase, partial [Alphaproteobacteria bacterium]|nr:fatty acid desaturase [Alphaproteobacteria bacterium]